MVISLEEHFGKPLGLLDPRGFPVDVVDVHVRVSTQNQADFGNHFDQAWEVVCSLAFYQMVPGNVTYEIGTGKKLEDRPLLEQSLARSRRTGVPVVIANRQRLIRGRNYKKTAESDVVDRRDWQALQDDDAIILLCQPVDTDLGSLRSKEIKRGQSAKRSKGGRPKIDRAARDQQILELYEQGFSFRRIAEKLGIGKSTVGRFLKSKGIHPAGW